MTVKGLICDFKGMATWRKGTTHRDELKKKCWRMTIKKVI